MGDEFNISLEENEVECGGSTLKFAPIVETVELKGNLYILLWGECEQGSGCIEPPNWTQNLVSISSNCKFRWVCEKTSGPFRNTTSEFLHCQIIDNLGTNPITRGPEGRFFEFNSKNGELEDTWSSKMYKICGSYLSFRSGIDNVGATSSRYIISTIDGNVTRFFSFDDSGDLCWYRRENGKWRFHIVDNILHISFGHYNKNIDPSDGSILSS